MYRLLIADHLVATLVGRGAGKAMAPSMSQIFASLQTEAQNQDTVALSEKIF